MAGSLHKLKTQIGRLASEAEIAMVECTSLLGGVGGKGYIKSTVGTATVVTIARTST